MSDPNHSQHPDHHPALVSRNARYGLVCFAVYVLFYAGFVFVSAYAPPEKMQADFWAGVNLPIVYGMALIVAALVLAMIYMRLCRAPMNGRKQ